MLMTDVSDASVWSWQPPTYHLIHAWTTRPAVDDIDAHLCLWKNVRLRLRSKCASNGWPTANTLCPEKSKPLDNTE